MTSLLPVLVMDQHFRRVEELFSPKSYRQLGELCSIKGGTNWPMEREDFCSHLSEAEFIVAAKPTLDHRNLDHAPRLRAIIEVSGTFQTGIDYESCFARGIEVLSCAPGFRQSVAEMTLGLMLAGCRGIVNEHERFRNGSENWLKDNENTDFSIYGQNIGFIGYGAIARECHRLLEPFRPNIRAFDPWLQASQPNIPRVEFAELHTVARESRCLIVAASPTDENYQLVSREVIDQLAPGTLVVLISRAHLVDFDALVEAADIGQIRFATDVFPSEPVDHRSKLRNSRNIILSPHRAAAVPGGRQLIGEMIFHDVQAILGNAPERQLQAASPQTIENIIRAPLVAQQGV